MKVVRPRESTPETQPQLQPALLNLSAIISQYRWGSLGAAGEESGETNPARVTPRLMENVFMSPRKYWEIIADNLSASGWTWGCSSHIDSTSRVLFTADAHRDNGKRFIVTADEKLTAFLELESQTVQGRAANRWPGAMTSLNL